MKTFVILLFFCIASKANKGALWLLETEDDVQEFESKGEGMVVLDSTLFTRSLYLVPTSRYLI